MKKTSIFLLILGAVIFNISIATADDVTIQAHNKLEYYWEREPDSMGVHSDSLRNKLVVDLLYGDFYAGVWFEAYHPLATPNAVPSDTSYEGITQRYFGWRHDNAEIRLGNYYANFNRGMILRAYEAEDIQVDKNIYGAWGSYSGRFYNFELLSGKILLADNQAITPLIRHRRNTVTGARAELTPIYNFRVGAGAVRYEEKDPFIDETYYTNAWEIIGGFNYGIFDFYGNYARQNGTRGFSLGRFDLEEGDGTYLTAGISTSLIGIAAEYKNYYNLGMAFNAPPAANHRNQSPNTVSGGLNGANDRGFQISTFLSPFDNWTFQADVAQSQERPDPETGHARAILYNNFYEVRGYIGRHNVILNYERTDMGFEGLEHLPYGEITYYLNDRSTVTATGQVRKYENQRKSKGKDDWNEIDYSVTLNYSYSLSITVSGGFTSEEFTQFDDPFPSRSGAVSVNIRYGEHDLNIFYGDQRGGFVCTEGACREVPPFRGMKMILVSRF
ncbi:MAG: hypothetical protein GF307_01590 [candidate division Zixibacteria bacterium]|nr:hypothetical protein [candidate division Zixibacteria bacterium]